jgi:hypothetical protein
MHLGMVFPRMIGDNAVALIPRIEITQLFQYEEWGDLRAEFALVNMGWLHGYEPGRN